MQMIAPAKVNLYLHVMGKRQDGYHMLDSLVVFTDFGDLITIEKNDVVSLTVTGEFADAAGDDNIILKAAKLLAEDAGLANYGAKISLQKNIPVGAGLGGGSSDAAVCLKLLNKLWELGYSENKLMELGLMLGADVPVCIRAVPSIMSGIGEVVIDAPVLPEFHMLLVNPMRNLPTIDVFRNNKYFAAEAGDHYRQGDFIAFLQNQRNDLTESAIGLMPEIAEVLALIEKQDGNILARMSGSGATCFGLFENKDKLVDAVRSVKQARPNWFAVQALIPAQA